MSNSNHVMLRRVNLTRDPEVKTVGQSTVYEFGIAKNNGYMEQGQWVEKEPYFFNAMIWNPSQTVVGFLHKGKTVTIIGELVYQSWEDNGQKKSAVKIKALSIDPIEKQEQGQGGGYAPPQASAPAYQPPGGYNQYQGPEYEGYR